VVIASGKDVPSGTELHTNFKIDREGEYLAIVNSASTVIDEILPVFPLQYPGYSYGLIASVFYYLQPPTPGADNSTSSNFDGLLADVSFSHSTGFYDTSFNLTLFQPDSLAQIYYTTNGATPDSASGTLYSGPILIQDLSNPGPPPLVKGPVIRAQAHRSGYVPSKIESHTYLVNLAPKFKSLPIVSVITSPDNIVGPWGILDNTYCNAPPEVDVYGDPIKGCFVGCCTNVMGRGLAWERPANVEWFNDEPGRGFEADCGIRLHASGSARPGVTPLYKASLRVYFREEYGDRNIPNTVFPRSPVANLKRMVLRGGKNDDSNPFITDEWMRRTFSDTGQVGAVGELAWYFLNGRLGYGTGYYNPCERLDDDFMQDHHGGSENWDVIRNGGVGDGTDEYLKKLLKFASEEDLSNPAKYQIFSASLDVVNYIDYILVNIYGDTGDWPGGNNVMATEHVPDWQWRMYMWDAEWALWGGLGSDTIADVLEVGTAPIQVLYQALDNSSTFRSLFAQRFRKQFYENGAITDGNCWSRWVELMGEMREAIPVMAQDFVSKRYAKLRPRYMMVDLYEKGLLEPLNDLPASASSTLSINEFMASNGNTVQDETGQYADWIEIYNGSVNPATLDGMYLTDNLSAPTKWQFPAGTTIDPFEFLLVWADGDMGVATSGIHTNYLLDKEGEEIGLFDTDANGNRLLDSVVFHQQERDVSEGRRPDGAGDFAPLPVASPGASNGTVPPSSNPGDYWVRAPLQIGRGVRDIAVGDVDNDTYPDMVCTDYDFGRVAVLINNGPGTRTFRGPIYYPNALGNKGVALGDLNKDGHLDIVTANDRLIDYNLSVLLNNGDGTFGTPTFYALYSLTLGTTELQHPHHVVVEDFNGDTYVDVLITNESASNAAPNRAHLYLNKGDHSGDLVTPGQEIALSGASEDFTGANVVSEDFDGDGDADLVSVTNFRNMSVSLNNGDGTFALAVAVSGAFARSTSVASGDFDNDGDVDFVGVSGSTNLFIYLNNGDGTFASPSTLNGTILYAPENPDPLIPPRVLEVATTADVDQDGNLDIVAATWWMNTALGTPGCLVFLNNGDGSFRFEDQGIGFPASADDIAWSEAIQDADFDDDGAPDIAVADSTTGDVVVFFNETEEPPPAPTPTPGPVPVLDWERY